MSSVLVRLEQLPDSCSLSAMRQRTHLVRQGRDKRLSASAEPYEYGCAQ